jgi:hypothetical protein
MNNVHTIYIQLAVNVALQPVSSSKFKGENSVFYSYKCCFDEGKELNVNRNRAS